MREFITPKKTYVEVVVTPSKNIPKEKPDKLSDNSFFTLSQDNMLLTMKKSTYKNPVKNSRARITKSKVKIEPDIHQSAGTTDDSGTAQAANWIRSSLFCPQNHHYMN